VCTRYDSCVFIDGPEGYCTEKKNSLESEKERFGNAEDATTRCITDSDLSHRDTLIGLISSECLNKSEEVVTQTSDSTNKPGAAILTAAGAIAEEDSCQPRQLHRLHFLLSQLHNLLEGLPECSRT
jgi:hypothetical protein